jgi:uncharacterized damage-inducible protein DinB
MAAMPHADWQATRTSFFPSLARTQNHVLAADLYCVGALYREPDPMMDYRDFEPCADLAAYVRRQRECDGRRIAFCDALDGQGVDAWVEPPRGDHVQRDRVAHVLAHLFNHQTHHRGQLHAMLSGTAVAPPQLDEFMLPSEAQLRRAEMQALGWDEAAVYATTRGPHDV